MFLFLVEGWTNHEVSFIGTRKRNISQRSTFDGSVCVDKGTPLFNLIYIKFNLCKWNSVMYKYKGDDVHSIRGHLNPKKSRNPSVSSTVVVSLFLFCFYIDSIQCLWKKNFVYFQNPSDPRVSTYTVSRMGVSQEWGPSLRLNICPLIVCCDTTFSWIDGVTLDVEINELDCPVPENDNTLPLLLCTRCWRSHDWRVGKD